MFSKSRVKSMKKLVAVFMVALMIAPVMVALLSNAAYVQQITVQRIVDDQAAIQSLEQGSSQARLFRIKNPDTINQMKQKGFQVITAASGLVNILVNPANECQNGMKNIFADRNARLALQFLIPRDQIVTQIYKGYAIPVIIPWTPRDPDFPYLAATALKWQAIINAKGQQYGVQLMEKALKDMGASKGADGKWYWSNGQPVTVNFVIRTEDARKQIGDMLANILEQRVGIKVNRLYKNFEAAFKIVYSGNPAACEWQLYTEGWGISGMTRYDYGNFIWFYSSIWGAMPGWLVSSYWNYKNATIDKIANELQSGTYMNSKNPEKEFWKLINEGVNLGIEESVRVFVAATLDAYIANPNLKGIIPSPKAAPWHTFTYMNLQYTQPSVVLTDKYVYASGWAWNPVGGFQDYYSVMVINALTWPGITSRVTDGLTGWAPAHDATWKILGYNVTVPSDAILYDHAKHKYVTAGEDNITNATVAVEINYKLLGKIKFHDGTTETTADLLAPLYMIFEYSYNDTTNTSVDNRYDSALAGYYSQLLSSFVAVKIVNSTTIITYLNFNNIDKGTIAQTADLWTSWPLELYAGMDLLVRYATPNVQAPANVTPGYVLTIDSSDDYHPAVHLLDTYQDQQMVNLLEQYKANPPDWVKQLIQMGLLTQQEWETRVDNLVNFYNEHHHLVIANGPFYLDSYNAQSDTAVLKRVADFPIQPQQVAQELQPKTVTMQVSGLPVAYNTKGSAIAELKVNVNGNPAKAEDVIIYALLVDTKTFNSTFLTVKYVKPGDFEAILPEDVPAASYQLVVLAYPVGYSFPAESIKTVTLVTPPQTTSSSTTTTSTQSTSTSTGSTTTTGQQTTTGSTTTTTTTSKTPVGTIVGAIIVVIIIIGAAYYFMKK